MAKDRSGSVSGINAMGAEWGFTLYDDQSREIVTFSFHLRADAVKARRAMSDMVVNAMAISPAQGGYRLTLYDPFFERKMAKAEDIISRYRNTLHVLAR